MSITKKITAPRYDWEYFGTIDVKEDVLTDERLPRLPLSTQAFYAIDKQAFDTLYAALQEIGTITQRGIRNGDKGYKPALKKIMKICREIE